MSFQGKAVEALLVEAGPAHIISPFDRLERLEDGAKVLAMNVAGMVGKRACIAHDLGYVVWTIKGGGDQ